MLIVCKTVVFFVIFRLRVIQCCIGGHAVGAEPLSADHGRAVRALGLREILFAQ